MSFLTAASERSSSGLSGVSAAPSGLSPGFVGVLGGFRPAALDGVLVAVLIVVWSLNLVVFTSSRTWGPEPWSQPWAGPGVPASARRPSRPSLEWASCQAWLRAWTRPWLRTFTGAFATGFGDGLHGRLASGFRRRLYGSRRLGLRLRLGDGLGHRLRLSLGHRACTTGLAFAAGFGFGAGLAAVLSLCPGDGRGFRRRLRLLLFRLGWRPSPAWPWRLCLGGCLAGHLASCSVAPRRASGFLSKAG